MIVPGNYRIRGEDECFIDLVLMCLVCIDRSIPDDARYRRTHHEAWTGFDELSDPPKQRNLLDDIDKLWRKPFALLADFGDGGNNVLEAILRNMTLDLEQFGRLIMPPVSREAQLRPY